MDMEWIYYHGDHPPHHFLRFSRFSLVKALEINGFSQIAVYSLVDLNKFCGYIERKLFGEKIQNIKNKIKSVIVGDYRKGKYYSLEEIEKISATQSIVSFLKILKLIRNFILLPLALFYIVRYKDNGLNLYFQAKK
jgi:large-conductance mechanosensitive channel